MIKNDLEHH